MRIVEDMRENFGLLTVTALGVGFMLSIGALNGRTNWPVYLAVIVVGAILVLALHVRFRFTRATRIGLAIFALTHVAGGMMAVGDDALYHWWLLEPIIRYDSVQHAVGFGFVGRAFWEIFNRGLSAASRSRSVAWWIVVLGAGTFGAVNEIVEWIMTLTIPGTDVGGYDNTVRDLVADLVGGVAIGLWTALGIGRDDSRESPLRRIA